MSVFIVQLGTPRKPSEGLRLRAVRRTPRGVPKSDFAGLNNYEVWFPRLPPSSELTPGGPGSSGRADVGHSQPEVPARDQRARSKPGNRTYRPHSCIRQSLAGLLLRGRE